MDTKVIIVGTSLLVVGSAAVMGGTFSWFTTPLPMIGFNALQVGGVIVALVGVGTLAGWDPMGLKQAAGSTAF
jgi:hypothetical protein